MSEEKTEYGVFVKFENESSDYNYKNERRTTVWIQAYPVVLNYKYKSAGDLDWRFCGGLAGEEYEHLVLDAMMSTDCESQTLGDVSLRAKDIYAVQTHEVERLLKSMKAIQKKFKAVYETDGNALSYGQSVARFAKAIGAKTVIIERSKKSQEVTGERFEKLTVGNGVYAIDRMMHDWKESKKEACVA